MFVYLSQMHKNSAVAVAVALLFASIAAALPAQIKTADDLSKIHIKNFGRTDENYYRGAQPENQDYKDLATAGVKTVIDLTYGGRFDEKGLVERAGMKFYRIPLKTSERPAESAVAKFLELVKDPSNWPVYVHCQGGRHRTGAMTAVYRMTKDGWTADRAYAEMKQYHFEGFPGHPELKSFVYDYYAHLDHSREAETVKPAKAAGIPK
jgi:protein tyrosine/serine phosphatase